METRIANCTCGGTLTLRHVYENDTNYVELLHDDRVFSWISLKYFEFRSSETIAEVLMRRYEETLKAAKVRGVKVITECEVPW